MTSIMLLQKSINYMEEHLLEEINYLDVSIILGMSSYEFHRTFSSIIGMTANSYIRSRRLSLAGMELAENDEKVIDIALKYGYDTPESFTKAFIRFHGISPKQAKQQGAKLCLFNPLSIQISMEGGKSMDYQMRVSEGATYICLKRKFKNETINEIEDNGILDFWAESNEQNLIEEIRQLRPDGKKDLYGLCSPVKEENGLFEYGIGVIVDQDTKPFDRKDLESKGFSIWKTYKQQYVVFECMGTDGDCISDTWQRFFKEFLPQTGYSSSEETDYEIYFEKGKPGVFCELWIPIESK